MGTDAPAPREGPGRRHLSDGAPAVDEVLRIITALARELRAGGAVPAVVAGHSFGDRHNAFANFFFGGFGNNWIDCASEKRYRDYYSFPGVALNYFGGVNYGKVMVEWNLPPLRFRRLGFTSFYTRRMRTSVFASSMRPNFDASKGSEPLPTFGVQRTLVNFGLQADFRLVTLSRFDSTFSLGYAVAMEGDAFSKEFMISLKIL